MKNIEREVEVLKRQIHSLRKSHQALDERVDTVFSPIWKRVWWYLQGYRWHRVGRWYGKTKDLY
jgi:hypothetical protein